MYERNLLFEVIESCVKNLKKAYHVTSLLRLHFEISFSYVVATMNLTQTQWFKYYYSQTRIKCSRPISSLPGLQGYKIFADAIIKILISTKSISDKNCYDQLFINKVVQIFTFQFDESVTKFYVVKVLAILMKFS